MAWLDSLDRVAPENKTKACANVVSSWAASDPAAAGSWLLEARRCGEAAPEITASYARPGPSPVPIRTRPRKSGKAKVVVRSPPKVFPKSRW